MDNLKKNIILTPFNLLYKISPELELKLFFLLRHGYRLDLKDPKTYSEKLQWIKLYDKHELMPICCDKYAVRGYVEKMGYKHLLNTLYWHGTDVDSIPFDTLPDKFVIKVTHGSTFNIIVKDKSTLDIKDTKKKLRKWLKAKFLPCYGEWYYGVVPPQIIIEQYLENEGGELYDYKVYCFNGKAKVIEEYRNRFKGRKRNTYDLNWNELENFQKEEHFEKEEKPVVLDEMIKAAEDLASPFHHARVDFYIVKDKLYFGEITFANGSGFEKPVSYALNLEWGKWLDLK